MVNQNRSIIHHKVHYEAIVKLKIDESSYGIVRNIELRFQEDLFCAIHLGNEWGYTSLYIHDLEFTESILKELSKNPRDQGVDALKSAFFNLLRNGFFEQPFQLQLRKKPWRQSYFILKRIPVNTNENIKLFSFWDNELVRELDISDPHHKYVVRSTLFFFTNKKNPAILELKQRENGWRYYIHIDNEIIYIRRPAIERLKTCVN